MAIREVDAIGEAIIETEREIAGDAWGMEDTERDEGDRSLESMGEGLEGGHEPEEDDESEAEEAEGEEESEGEEDTVVAAKPEPGKDGKGEQQEAKPDPAEARVPSGKLREANDRARAAEAERDTIKAENEKRSKALEDKLELALRQIDDLRRAPRVEPPKQVEQPKPKRPDLFEDPDGAIAFVEQGVQQQIAPLSQQIHAMRIQNSMQIAEEIHGEAFTNAFGALMQLDKQDPGSQLIVKRIVDSPNPGRAVLSWHKQQQTLARVGDDPAKFEERIRTETREALMKDPEFRKQLIAELRGDAARGDNGQARTTVRLPKSLHGAAGSNIGVERGDPHQYDDSESAVAESAWR